MGLEYISFAEKYKLWLYAMYVAAKLILRQSLSRIWKSQNATPVDKKNSFLANVDIGKHLFIKINNSKGTKLHCVEMGSRKSPIMVLLHGFPDYWFGWRNQLSYFSKHYRVVAIDLKGFADSEKPQWRCNYGVHILVQEISEFILALGSHPCIVVGHDIGAMLGWYLISQNPSLVRKFVAIACPHPNVNFFCERKLKANSFMSNFIDMCLVPYLPEYILRQDNGCMIEKFHSHLHKEKNEEILSTYKYVFSREEDVSGPLHYFRNFLLTRLSDSKLSVPTLLLVGNRDSFIAPEDCIRSTNYLENYELKIVENAGHFPHQEESGQVNELISTFLCDDSTKEIENKTEYQKGLIGSLVTNTFKYGNSLMDNVRKKNGVVW